MTQETKEQTIRRVYWGVEFDMAEQRGWPMDPGLYVHMERAYDAGRASQGAGVEGKLKEVLAELLRVTRDRAPYEEWKAAIVQAEAQLAAVLRQASTEGGDANVSGPMTTDGQPIKYPTVISRGHTEPEQLTSVRQASAVSQQLPACGPYGTCYELKMPHMEGSHIGLCSNWKEGHGAVSTPEPPQEEK